MEARLQMLENKLTAAEHMGRYNDSVRSQDIDSRMLTLEATVRGAGCENVSAHVWGRSSGNGLEIQGHTSKQGYV